MFKDSTRKYFHYIPGAISIIWGYNYNDNFNFF